MLLTSKKPRRNKRRNLASRVSVEISRSGLLVVVLEGGDGGTTQVRGYRTPWHGEGPDLQRGENLAELMEALAAIVDKEELAGGAVHVALSGDYCITRVIAGETDQMLSELRLLRDRADHYLLLGPGPKAVSQAVRALDVRNSQASVTVTSRDTVDNLQAALGEAGLHADLIEHSMVAICRAVGRMGGDTTAPALVIEASERSVDVGVSYRGQLLFDYRPGGIAGRTNVAETVERHLDRIQRYCNRFFRFASGSLQHVYLVGSASDVDSIHRSFHRSTRLTAEILNPAAACADWTFADPSLATPDYVASLGTALVPSEDLSLSPDERGFPDLMDVFRSHQQFPVWPMAKRHLWPIAAAGLLSVLVYGGAQWQKARAIAVEQQVAEMDAESGHAATLRREHEALAQRVKYLQTIDRDLVMLPIDELVSQIVRAKPAQVFLDSLQIAPDGLITVEGKAISREAVYELEGRLKGASLFRSLRVESTRPERLPTVDNATGFTLKAKFADSGT